LKSQIRIEHPREERRLTISRRLPKERRRSQLLQTALAIVREEGTEALTLAHLAERAGVTKPIAYEHFGTRAGLLIALFRDYDERTAIAVREALQTGGATLEEVATILGTAYIDTCLNMGSEIGAIYDALSASAETESFRREWRAFLVEEFRAALEPFVNLSHEQSTAVLMGVIGAAQTLASSAAAGEISRSLASETLVRLIVGAFDAPLPIAPNSAAVPRAKRRDLTRLER
jgi:AcrR family transcriptional regulator